MCLTMVYYFGGYMTQMEWWVGDLGFHASAAATSSHYLPPPPRPTARMVYAIVTTFISCQGFICWAMDAGFSIGCSLHWQSMYRRWTSRRHLPSIGCSLFTSLCSAYSHLHKLLLMRQGKSKEVVSGWIIRIIQLDTHDSIYSVRLL